MKTSRKILLVTGGLIIAFVIYYFAVARAYLLSYLDDKNKDYKPVKVEEFDKLYFSSHWNVTIRQGREVQVEVDDASTTLKPKLENRNGALYLAVTGSDDQTPINVKIAVPELREIHSVQGTVVRIDNYEADSLTVFLGDGGVFNGNNNKIKYFFLKTEGKAEVNVRDLAE
ncbi:MAG: DUF2807 domain-containing protein [Cyclobacteriaceae bacterium]|nr:DUF2807 domain-containing protein [Cyclobacteriaceae bacterium]